MNLLFMTGLGSPAPQKVFLSPLVILASVLRLFFGTMHVCLHCYMHLWAHRGTQEGKGSMLCFHSPETPHTRELGGDPEIVHREGSSSWKGASRFGGWDEVE